MRALSIMPLGLLIACFEPPTPEAKAPPPGATEVKADLPMRPPGGAPDGVVKNMEPRILKVRIEPAEPNISTPLLASAEVADTDTPVVDTDFVWVINGKERPDLASETLDTENFVKGDKIAVKAIASDGDNEVERVSGEITIRNSAPAFMGDPRAAGQIDGLVLRAEDPDGDALTFSMSGQPDGMRIDPKSGRISYKGSQSEKGGAYQVVVRVDDGDGGEARWEFDINVSAGMTAEEQKRLAEEQAATGG